MKEAREEEAAARGAGIPAVAEGKVVFRMVKAALLLLLLLLLLLKPMLPFNSPPPLTPTPGLAMEGAANPPPTPGARLLVSREEEAVEEEALSSCIAAARLTPPPLPSALLSPRAGTAAVGSSAKLCRLTGSAVRRSGEHRMTEAAVVPDDDALDEEGSTAGTAAA